MNINNTKLAIGIYYVIGYGSDCDGQSGFHCYAYVNERKAIEDCNSHNEWSDGIQYNVTSDMRVVQDYCDSFDRGIPFAIVEQDDWIRRKYTYID